MNVNEKVDIGGAYCCWFVASGDLITNMTL